MFTPCSSTSGGEIEPGILSGHLARAQTALESENQSSNYIPMQLVVMPTVLQFIMKPRLLFCSND